MVRFSTVLCRSESPPPPPPPPKRLKPTSADGGSVDGDPCHEHGERSLPILRRPCSSSADRFSCYSAAFLDLDTLDCIVCMEVLVPPIYQCSNGHYACNGCTQKLCNKCPSCSEPVGKIRNLGLEKILESLKVRCKYYDQGCSSDLLPYAEKKVHEQKCVFAPHDCPLADCRFNGPLGFLGIHFMECHNVKSQLFHYDAWFTLALSLNDKYMLLHSNDDSFFLFEAHDEPLGKIVYISSLLPLEQGGAFTYTLEVKYGQSHLTLASTVQNHAHKNVDRATIDFLLIPKWKVMNEEGFQVEISMTKRATLE